MPYDKVELILVSWQNDNCIKVHYTDKVELNDNFIIETFLFIPEFTINLISLLRLCRVHNHF